ncbi:MAG: putative ubiquitin-like protein YukD [Myxococcota bacterium]|jgi:uncharacterized ubiquitin-like protein YukD
MDYAGSFAEGDQTVTLRVQVVDMQSFTLDLQVPTFLPAQDLTQRIVRDAGLDSHWQNGQRRLYWLRARGRLLGDKETLSQLGVIDGELVYLLPEPPHGSGVLEQPPDYPENFGYAGSGIPALMSTVGLVVAWAVGWGAALSVSRQLGVVLLPGVGLGLLCCNFARHAWGGQAYRARVALTALVLFIMMMALTLAVTAAADLLAPSVLTALPGRAVPPTFEVIFRDVAPGVITGFLGVFVGWLAWWGAVEPLPEQAPTIEAAQEAVAVVDCGICRGSVTAEVRMDCPFNCGQHFHSGCYQARVAVYRGDQRFCAVCNAQVA